MGRRILIAAMGFVLFVLLWVCLLGSALANDSSVELMTGGLVFTKNNDVEMLSEDLSISTERNPGQLSVSKQVGERRHHDSCFPVA